MTAQSLRYVIGTVFVLLCSLSGNASADKLDDFKSAAGKKGCQLIPYESERSQCESLSDKKDRICTNYSCSRDDATKLLSEYKEKRQNLENAKNRNDEQAARSLEETVRVLDNKLRQIKSDAGNRLARAAEDCLAARESVLRYFNDMKTKVGAEKAKELEPYVNEIVTKFDSGFADHKVAMQDAIRAMDNCRWVSNISW